MGVSIKKKTTGGNGVNHRLKPAFLPMDEINILTQVRRTWSPEHVEELEEGICFIRGLLEPIIVVNFDLQSAQEYLALTNRYYRVSHKLKDLVQSADSRYLIVLSGEMRLRAHRLIWEEGCSACRELYGREAPGKCFSRHLTRRKLVEVRLHRDIPVNLAMDIQLMANDYEAPPESEMIRGLGVRYRFKKDTDPNLTIAKFARSVGRSPATMSKYLKIYDLPQEIFELLEPPKSAASSGERPRPLISSGIAFELAFLKEQGEKDLKWWALRAIAGRMKVEYFHRKVREYLAVKNQGVLDLFESSAEAAAKRAHIKMTVNQEMVNGVYGNLAYWRKVLTLFERGQLGKDDSPFSADSPTRLYRQQVELMKEAVLPHLSEFLSAEKVQEVHRVLGKVEELLAGQPAL